MSRSSALTRPAPASHSAAPRRFVLSREAWFLLAICFFDTFSSAYLFGNGLATEANPLLQPSVEAGLLPFMSVKMLTFIPAVLAAEWYGRVNPAFVRPLLRWTATLYLAVYCILVGIQWG